ncbi:hypothetical protein GCM10027395_21400 [Giesbergeria sinuosa]
MVQVLLLIAVLSGLATMGYLQWRERSAIDASQQERQALAQADLAILTFATVLKRLPCPDTNRDGLEDCGGGTQKGWLPSLTLSLAGADAGVDVGQLRYLIQRGGGAFDLTVLDDAWRPLEYDDTGKTFASMSASNGALTLADLCQRLNEGGKASYTAGMAEVRSTPVRTVAYALVHPGINDADGDGSLFDGVNASADSAVEDPIRRPLLASYNDIVLEKSFANLYSTFHCQTLIDSINTVALGLDVVQQVEDLRQDNIDSAKRAVAFAALGAGITAIETTSTAMEAGSDGGNAAAEWATCAASLGLAVNACAAAPQHTTTATVLTAGVIAANVVSIGLNVTAAVMAGNALALADSSKPASSLSCPAVDMSQAVNAAKAEWDTAKTDKQTISTKITQKQTDLAIANTAKTNAMNTLWAQVRSFGSTTTIDNRIQTVFDAASNWQTQSSSVSAASLRVTNYQTAVTSWDNQITSYTNKIANRTTMITQLQGEIATLDAQIAATTNPSTKESLQKQRLEKTSELTLLNDPATLQSEYNKAVVEKTNAQNNLNTAQSDLIAAQSSLGSAQTSYQSAYNSLLNAGRYSILNASGAVIATGCSTSSSGICQAGDTSTYSGINAALRDLFGTSTTSPDPDGKYLLPSKIEKEIAALQAQLDKASDRETNAKSQYDTLKAQADNPPPCNITGSGVTPMSPNAAENILKTVDQKGGTR